MLLWQIVVLEAEDENCMLLKKNTHRFKNVNVKCGGLWRRDNITLALVPGRLKCSMAPDRSLGTIILTKSKRSRGG